MGWDKKIYYSFSKIYYPTDFQTEKIFVEKMKDEFCIYFDEIWKVYSEGGEVEEIDPLLRLQE